MLESCDDLVKARLTSWLIEQRQLSIEWPEIYSATISDRAAARVGTAK